MESGSFMSDTVVEATFYSPNIIVTEISSWNPTVSIHE